MRTFFILLFLSFLSGLMAKTAYKSAICGLKASFVGKCKGYSYIPRKKKCVRISGYCSGRGNFFKRLEDCISKCV
ncbi:uncharacterized protein LOC108110612 [Drosophila eugracilis]|uniref:uncharacterized protein LOC108110612 n=1 Tax=Drosophila eugracilis TaxID=29029 RepID=UPI001BDA2CFC|nr:uncharacterized protein LOC108110612 [Drosophila eugracilis]